MKELEKEIRNLYSEIIKRETEKIEFNTQLEKVQYTLETVKMYKRIEEIKELVKHINAELEKIEWIFR